MPRSPAVNGGFMMVFIEQKTMKPNAKSDIGSRSRRVTRVPNSVKHRSQGCFRENNSSNPRVRSQEMFFPL